MKQFNFLLNYGSFNYQKTKQIEIQNVNSLH